MACARCSGPTKLVVFPFPNDPDHIEWCTECSGPPPEWTTPPVVRVRTPDPVDLDESPSRLLFAVVVTTQLVCIAALVGTVLYLVGVL